MNSMSLLLDKFWNNVTKTEGCWIWNGFRNGQGYGVLFIKSKGYRAHRASFEIHYGPIPPGMMACHTCDTPSCVNPEHIFLGTAKDNAIDAVRKGRMSLDKATAIGAKLKLAKTTCKRGHPFSGDNLFINRDGYRGCKTCRQFHNKSKGLREVAAN